MTPLSDDEKMAWSNKVASAILNAKTFVILINNEQDKTDVISPLEVDEILDFVSAVFDKLNQGKFSRENLQ